MLRIFGDSFMDHLAWYADKNGCLEKFLCYVKEKARQAHFEAKEEDGYMSTTALQVIN